MVWVGLYSQWGIKIGKTGLVIVVYVLWSLESAQIDGFFMSYVFSFFFANFPCLLSSVCISLNSKISIDILELNFSLTFNLYGWVLFEY